jgi:hypothetical protein
VVLLQASVTAMNSDWCEPSRNPSIAQQNTAVPSDKGCMCRPQELHTRLVKKILAHQQPNANPDLAAMAVLAKATVSTGRAGCSSARCSAWIALASLVMTTGSVRVLQESFLEALVERAVGSNDKGGQSTSGKHLTYEALGEGRG